MTQSRLADKLAISQGHLSKIEAGLLPVPEALLFRLSDALGYPRAFFALSEPIFGPGTSEFFHRKRSALSSRLLVQLHAQINIRRIQLARLLHAVELGPDRIPELDPDVFGGSIEDVARAVRASWSLPRGPVENVTRAIEDAGGIVVLVDFGTPLLDAVSRFVPGMPPLFFTNRASPGDRQRLTLVHELGHIVMHRVPQPDMEPQAFRFAAEFLMPEAEIRTELDDLSLDRLVALKLRWRVSMQALLKRSEDLGRITPRHARYLWMLLGKAGFRTREPVEGDLAPEQPTLMTEIVDLYRTQFGYTPSQIADLLAINEGELRSWYGIEPSVGKGPVLRLVGGPAGA